MLWPQITYRIMTWPLHFPLAQLSLLQKLPSGAWQRGYCHHGSFKRIGVCRYRYPLPHSWRRLCSDDIRVGSLLDQRVARVKSVTGTTSFVLEGVDTSDTSKYPATTGVGTFRKINTWSTLSQVKGISASGGAQQFADITSISDTVIRQIPTVKDAVNMTVDVFDDPALTWYADVIAADTARSPYALLMTFPNGSKLVANAYWSVMKVPTMETNQALMTQISLSYAAEPVRYSS